MPLHSEVLAKRWSTANLPILPFLAPRVFQPWPSTRGRSRRTHTSGEASQSKQKTTAPSYDNLPVLDRKGQKKSFPSLLEEAEEASHRARVHKDNIASSPWSSSFHDYNAIHAGRGASVIPEPTKTRISPASKHVSAALQDSHQDGRLLPIHDETATASGGSVIWRRVGTEATGYANETSGRSFDVLPDSIGDETIKWKFGKRVKLGPRSSTSENVTTSIEGTSTHLPNSPNTSKKARRFERDLYSYWQNALNDLKHQITRQEAKDRAMRNNMPWKEPVSNPFDKRKASYPFDRRKVHGLYQKDLDELWADLTRLNKAECEVWWNELVSRNKLRLWPGLMLRALRDRPSDALKLLEIKYTDTQPPAYAISDSLNYLVDHYLIHRERSIHVEDTELKDRTTITIGLQKLVTRWLNYEYGVRVLQKTIWTLVKNLEDGPLHSFYNDLRRLHHYLYPNTLIHFASRFAKSSNSDLNDLGFAILKELHGRIDFEHPAVMSLCTTILHRSHQATDTSSTVAEKFKVMLDLGMKVNIIIYNVLIQNAIQSGDSEAAWNIHEMMLENEIEPDEFTYSLLLNDAKRRMDSAAIRAVMGHIQEKGIAGPHIATDQIHLIYLLHQNSEQESEERESVFVQRSRRKAGFEKMLGKYCEHFNAGTLQNLIPRFLDRFPQANDYVSSGLPDPSAHTLTIMMTGLLHSLNSTATKVQYEHFIQLLRQKEKSALLITGASPHIWNVFLMALGRFDDLLSECPKVIKTMISFRDDEKDRFPRRHTTQEYSTAEPDNYTWSILVNIFTKHKQLRAAEKVITAMQSRGTFPNEATWTTLAYGYSRIQDVEKMADTIHRMESNGVVVGDQMVAAMAGIQDREGLMRALKKKKADS